MKDKAPAPWGYHTRSNVDGGGDVPSSHNVPEGVTAQHQMFFPILGVIDAVYYADNPDNDSNSLRNPESTNVEVHDFLSNGEDDWYQRSVKKTASSGSRLEVRVKIISGPPGSGSFLESVPLCIGFGGVHNYGYVVPKATTNAGRKGFRGTEDGDYCLVQFLNGDYMSPVVTSIWPNPLNMEDAAVISDKEIAFARINGVEFLVENDGDVVLDARNANAKTVVDPDSGAYAVDPGDNTTGTITVVTSNDIYIAAGVPREGEGEGGLPEGTAVLQASKDVEVYSSLNSVKIYSPKDLVDDNGNPLKDDKGNVTNRVDIQGPRGSLRRAARQHDSVKMTSGNSGDLFTYLKDLHKSLNAVSISLMSSLDPGAAAAGEVLGGWLDSTNPPTYQAGEITTGSDYCYIAGKGDASDVGFDESGIKNALGEAIDPEVLDDQKDACFAQAVKDVEAEAMAALAKVEATTIAWATNSLKSAQKALEAIPGGQGSAFLIGLAVPKIVALLYSTFSTGAAPDSVALPSGSSLEDAVGTGGTGGVTGELSSVDAEYRILVQIKQGTKTAWDFYRENTKDIPQNPNRVNDPTLAADIPDPTIPGGELVEGAGYWYEEADLTDPLSTYYDATAISSRKSTLNSLGSALSDMVSDVVVIAKGIQDTTALIAAVMQAVESLDYKEVDKLTGGGLSQSANKCIDSKILEEQ